jgi:hypothetical protein
LAASRVQAISVFAEGFASPSSTSWSNGSGVGVNTSQWRTFTSGNHGARINGGRLEITSRRSSSAHGQGFAYVQCGGSGSVFNNGVYNPVLASNGSLVTWTFNMRKAPSNATTNGGFSCSSSANQNGVTIGLGFVLGSSGDAGILSSTSNCNQNGTADGYAVLHGGSNTIRLVRFDNGINNGTITTIATSQSVSYANYHSVRVTYNPANNAWTLQVRSDGSSNFSDPGQGSYPSTANGTDGVHVNTELNFMGGYFQAGCIGNCDDASSGYIASFDNINVDVACAPPAQPGAITGVLQVCQGANGSYSIDEVPGVTTYQWSYSGTGVTIDPSGTSAVFDFSASATSGTVNVSSVGDCASIPSTLAVEVLPLPSAPQGLTGPLVICSGTTNTYSLNAVADETYAWTLPAAWTGGDTGPSVDLVAEGTDGSLSVVATNGCGAGQPATLLVTVNTSPDVSLAPFPLICISTPSFPFTGGTPAGGTYTFNGVPATSFNPIVGIGSYTIGYALTDVNGCSGSDSQVLVVDACAGLGEIDPSTVRIFPNPTDQGYFFLEVPTVCEWTLHDASGRVLRTGNAPAGQLIKVDVDGLAAGMHFIEVRNGQHEVLRLPVVVQQ